MGTRGMRTAQGAPVVSANDELGGPHAPAPGERARPLGRRWVPIAAAMATAAFVIAAAAMGPSAPPIT